MKFVGQAVWSEVCPVSVAITRRTGHNDLMRHVSVAEAKAHFSELLADAEHRGRTVVVEKHGRAVAHLVPVPKPAPTKPKKVNERKKWVQDFEAAVAAIAATTTTSRGSMLRDLEASRGRLE
jgi:prevent-host-death family protein